MDPLRAVTVGNRTLNLINGAFCADWLEKNFLSSRLFAVHQDNQDSTNIGGWKDMVSTSVQNNTRNLLRVFQSCEVCEHLNKSQCEVVLDAIMAFRQLYPGRRYTTELALKTAYSNVFRRSTIANE